MNKMIANIVSVDCLFMLLYSFLILGGASIQGLYTFLLLSSASVQGSTDLQCLPDITKVTPYGMSCSPVCWNESTGIDDRHVTYRSHTPSMLFNLGRTEVTYRYNDTRSNQTRDCHFNVTVKEACVSGTIDAITMTSDGHTYMFVGDVVMRLTDDGARIADGYPKPICAVFPGLPSNLDAAVFWPNGETYFFKGFSYWTSRGTSVSSESPRAIADGFPGILTSVDAVVDWRKNKEIVYFFKGDKYWRFDMLKNRLTHVVALSIRDGWPGIGIPVDASLQWSNGITYFFTDENYWRYNDDADEAVSGYPYRTTTNWLGCKKTTGVPPVMLADSVCVPHLCSEHQVPTCLNGSFDAITHIGTQGSRGNIFIFRGMMVVKLTEASGDIEYGYPRPICSVFPGLPPNIDAALTYKDTGKSYFFKGDLCFRFTGFQMDRGFPKPVNTAFPGIPSDVDAAVMIDDNGEQQIFFFKGNASYKLDRLNGWVSPGYPKKIQREWPGIPNDVNGVFQWINRWTYFFKGNLFYRWDYSRGTVADGYPKQTSRTWFGCQPLNESNTCWVRQCP